MLNHKSSHFMSFSDNDINGGGVSKMGDLKVRKGETQYIYDKQVFQFLYQGQTPTHNSKTISETVFGVVFFEKISFNKFKAMIFFFILQLSLINIYKHSSHFEIQGT